MTTRPEGAAVREAGALRYAVWRMSRRLRRQAQHTLTPSQVSALSTLDRWGPLRLGQLVEREQMSKQGGTKLVAKLEKVGYLTRRVDPDDGRGFIVGLTDSGREVLTEASRRQDAYLARQIEALDPESRATLSAAIPVIEKLLKVRV